MRRSVVTTDAGDTNGHQVRRRPPGERLRRRRPRDERLRKERGELRAREQVVHAELTETRERLKRHAGSSKTFAASICGRPTERRRRRKRLSVQ